ncbi:MAG: Fe-S cluster assembly protein SufD, partial [Limisphaerales bacterium]
MTQTTPRASAKDAEPFLEKFRRFESEPRQPSWLLPLRKAGMARFAEIGFPTVHDEDWRFTNVAPLARLPFKPMSESTNDAAAQA